MLRNERASLIRVRGAESPCTARRVAQSGVTQSILYGGRWWLPPSPGRGESNEVVLPVACPNTKCVPRGELTHSWLVLCRKQVNE
jgi:hypothetical protein